MTENKTVLHQKITDTLWVLGVAVIYGSCARALLKSFPTMAFTGAFHLWIAIALALFLRSFRRYFPGVLIGTLAVNVITTQSVLLAIPIALGATLAACCGAWLIKRHNRFSARLFTLKDYLRLLFFGGCVASFVAALTRAGVLLSGDIIQKNGFIHYVLYWWMGDALGIALVAPLLIVFRTTLFKPTHLKRALEAISLLILCFLVGQVIFQGWFSQYLNPAYTSYWMFIFVAWAAIRLGTFGTALVLLMAAVQAFSSAYFRTGNIAADVFTAGVSSNWLYLMILSMVGMSLATYVDEQRRAEEALRGESLESLAQRDNALKEITQGVAIANADRIATYVNDAFISQTGFSREEIIGKSCKILQGPDTNPDTLARIKQQLTANLPFQGEILNYRKDGTPFWNDLSITPVFNDQGELIQWVGIQRDITAHKQALARIERLNHLYAALSHCNTAIVHTASPTELFEKVCESAVRYGGMRMAWIGTLNEATHNLSVAASYGIGTEYLDQLRAEMSVNPGSRYALTASAIVRGEPVWCQDLLRHPDAAPLHDAAEQYGFHSMSALPLKVFGKVVGNFTLYADSVDAFDEEARNLLLEMAQDVSFAIENFKRRRQIELAANVLEQSNEAIMIADANRSIVMVNKAFASMTGYAPEDILGKNMRGLYTGLRSEEAFKSVIDALDEKGRWQGEIWNRKKNGEPYLEWLSMTLMRDTDGNVSHYVGTSTDITQRKQDEERMHWLSHFDTLTGLPNRTLLEDRCKQALRMAQSSGDTMALMILDIDNFKTINDAIGLRFGDMLLSELADRFSFIVREHDTLSRVGGDEFVFALPGTDADGAAHLAEKIMGTIGRPFLIDNHELIVTASIGIAMFPTDGQEYTALMTSADLAMSRAKLDGRNTFRFFTPEIQARSMRTLQLENALRRALERDQMQMHYQPQISVETGKIIGAEALLRWEHPEFGAISPTEFIPIAESSGMVVPIGEWAMRTAARQLKTWIDSGHAPFTVSVNLSAAQFRHARLTELVMSALNDAGIPPKYFELELTESLAMENPEAAIAIMDQLHAHGIRMSIDDFGTGYSSLAHLKRFKVYKLKIDRSFVNDITTDPEDRAIVGAVISLAQNLGLRTTAEGVENEAQLNFLRDMGCDEIQGFYFSRPLSSDDFGAFLKDWAHRN